MKENKKLTQNTIQNVCGYGERLTGTRHHHRHRRRRRPPPPHHHTPSDQDCPLPAAAVVVVADTAVARAPTWPLAIVLALPLWVQVRLVVVAAAVVDVETSSIVYTAKQRKKKYEEIESRMISVLTNEFLVTIRT